MDKIGIFHANQTSMCLDPHQIGTMYHETSLSPLVELFLTDRSKPVFLLWIIFVI